MSPNLASAVFDETTLPDALRREHRTKAGVWGIIRVLEGRLLLHFPDKPTEQLDPDTPGLVEPEELHWVEPVGAMRMQVEFCGSRPPLKRS